jgi:hypothetical protein
MGCPTGAHVVFHFTLKYGHFKNLTRDYFHVHRFIKLQNSRLPVNRTLPHEEILVEILDLFYALPFIVITLVIILWASLG